MIIIIAVVGVALSSFSRADFQPGMMNIITWDEVAQFYYDYAGADVYAFSDMLDDYRLELCLAVGNAARFIPSSNRKVDIISGGIASVYTSSWIQRTTVLIDGNKDKRIIMPCVLENGDTFYLGRSYNFDAYFLFMTTDMNERPQLHAVVKLAINMTLGIRRRTLADVQFSEENDSRGMYLCMMPKDEILNWCASVHRASVQYGDHGNTYILKLELGEHDNCTPEWLETSPIEFHTSVPINVVTCKVLTYDGEITYKLTPHPTHSRTYLLVQPHEDFKYLMSISGHVTITY